MRLSLIAIASVIASQLLLLGSAYAGSIIITFCSGPTRN